MAVRKTPAERYGSAMPQSLDEVIERAAARGQFISAHTLSLMRAWVDGVGNTPAGEEAGIIQPKGQTYIELRMFPMPCTCTECKGSAAIFPPDKSCPHMSNGLSGYVLCPHCSFGIEQEAA